MKTRIGRDLEEKLRTDIRVTLLRSIDLMKCAGIEEGSVLSHAAAGLLKESATLIGAICQPKDFASLLRIFGSMMQESHRQFYEMSRKATQK